jgi:hypothetical protein
MFHGEMTLRPDATLRAGIEPDYARVVEDWYFIESLMFGYPF